jgi:transposase-like protein
MERRKFDAEFNLETVMLITSGNRRASDVVRNLGISENLLHLSNLTAKQQHANCSL